MRTLFRLGTMLSHSKRVAVFQDGCCLGVGGVQVRNAVTTLYGAVTRPEARGQGVQTALLQARLAATGEMGCTWATASANAGSTSSRHLERDGFAVSHSKVRFQHG
jgi:GNAT superfamily N-acetyltransferase